MYSGSGIRIIGRPAHECGVRRASLSPEVHLYCCLIIEFCKKFITDSGNIFEQLERLDALSKQFVAGIPTEAELQTCMTAADDLSDAQRQYADLSVSAENQKCLDGIEAELRDLRQERDRIRRSVENIPAWEDRMARLQNEQEEDERKCTLADQTLALLSQAKDNLANSYVGRVERGFENYANTLMGNQLGDVMVDKDLHLHIDEKGDAREVGSFSAGTIDCIMLCMRLSLVDALFGDEKPFLILDDPFVNLDDEHTKRALEMLDKIAQDHQVVYLVCNTSRK